MEFRTKLIVANNNKRTKIAYAGLFLSIFSAVLIFFPSMEDFFPWVFGAGVLLIITGAVLTKGNIALYGLSRDELVVTVDEIKIGMQSYSVEQLSKLDFYVEAYAGMILIERGLPSGASSDGMENTLGFEFNGAPVTCRFYLDSPQHALQLCSVFREFYLQHIPFVEHDRYGQTYLFQRLSDQELTKFRKEYNLL
jgi:hypothetical protein